MLNKETKEKLEGFGFDVSKLEDAIKSEEEKSLDVPTLYKEQGLTDEDKTKFGNNRFEEGKKAMSEIKAKEFKTKYEIELEHKDLDKVVDAVIAAKVKEVNVDPDKRVETLEADKLKLQETVTQLTEENSGLETDYSSKLFNIENESTIEKEIPIEGMKLSSTQLRKLFFLDHRVTKDDQGRTLYMKGDEKLVDNLLNPISVKDVVNSFLDEGKYKSKNGMGGEDTPGGGSTNAKFHNTDEFITWAAENNVAVMSEEGQKILADGKAPDFVSSSRVK